MKSIKLYTGEKFANFSSYINHSEVFCPKSKKIYKELKPPFLNTSTIFKPISFHSSMILFKENREKFKKSLDSPDFKKAFQ